MKKILIFIACYAMCATCGVAAVRDGTTTSRASASGTKTASQRVIATDTSDRTTTRTTILGTQKRTKSDTPQSNTPQRNTTTRPTVTRPQPTNVSATRATAIPRSTGAKTNSTITQRSPIPQTVSRAADDTSFLTETRTGAEYEKCKNTYFSCMDQFCQLKNDNYRRCSCSDRVFDLDSAFDTITQAGQKLSAFTENLDVVGMTAAQASAMRTPSEGENALTKDTSASKALLQAIMNSIRGKDSSVGGRYSDLNSINIAFDTANAFGTADAGQIIATYNGKSLYSAVYPSCRRAVRADCNDAALQRAVTAYLMAIEQDCNTVQSAVESKQKDMKSAVREGSAMLDLARVENRKNHNSSDFTTCLNNVESAILSEEVCGANYHKCLDNGEFIDISTGMPIAGVERFYELGNLLTFSAGIDAANQKLSQLPANRQFVQNFETHTKKFAADSLNHCVEIADDVWSEYLDKALLAIYYAQNAKVSEIKQTCFTYISSCYTNTDRGISAAISALTGDPGVVLQPNLINLTDQLCADYINSCNNMFDGNIIAEYINNRTDTDTKTACRAVAQQCFAKYGSTNYQNFYYPYSGTIEVGHALDWFILHDYSSSTATSNQTLISECAKQLAQIESCRDEDTLNQVFGGFNLYFVRKENVPDSNTSEFRYVIQNCAKDDCETVDNETTFIFPGSVMLDETNREILRRQVPNPSGVATETFNQIVDILSTQCSNIQGRFVELQNIPKTYDVDNQCLINRAANTDLFNQYFIGDKEDMCPRDYRLTVDIKSWGACLCWENGGRRSKWGKSATCIAGYPVKPAVEDNNEIHANDAPCYKEEPIIDNTTKKQTGISYSRKFAPIDSIAPNDFNNTFSAADWCTSTSPVLLGASTNQLCPIINTTEPYTYTNNPIEIKDTTEEKHPCQTWLNKQQTDQKPPRGITK